MEVNGYKIEPGAELEDTNLSGANLRDANLSGANLRDANLEGARMPDGTIHDQPAATRRSPLESRARQRTMGYGGGVSEISIRTHDRVRGNICAHTPQDGWFRRGP